MWWLDPGGSHRLPSRARPAAAWPSPPPSSFSTCGGFLRGTSQATAPRVRSTFQQKSGWSIAAVGAGAGPGCWRGRVLISHTLQHGAELSAGARASPGEDRSMHIDDLILSISLSLSSPRHRMERCRAQALSASSCSLCCVFLAVCGGGTSTRLLFDYPVS